MGPSTWFWRTAFRRDSRSISQVIGFILIGLIVLAMFTAYQVIAVPAQNAEVEFSHNQDVEDDMLEVRNAILDTKLTGGDRHATVRLGTEYPHRTFALNPPHPTGSLETTEPAPIHIADGSGSITDEVCGATDLDGVDHVQDETRLLEYTPQYNEFDGAGTLRYEHSVLYHDYPETNRIRSSQRLAQGDTITIIPLASDVAEQGKQKVSVEPKAGFLSTERVANPVIELPTELSESDWEEILAGEVDPANIEVVGGDTVRLTLTGSYQLRCGVIGLNRAPDSGDRGAFPALEEGIHPSEVAGVRFEGATSAPPGTQADIRLRFENLADSDITISRMGFNFYQGGDQDYFRIADNAQMQNSHQIFRGQSVAEITPPFELEGESTKDLYIRWDRRPSAGEWAVITVQFGTGERTQYFITAQ